MDGVLDILGVLIGFSAVMLLLSLLVMTLVQALQHVLQLRVRSLQLGLTAMLDFLLVPKEATALQIEADATHASVKVGLEACKKEFRSCRSPHCELLEELGVEEAVARLDVLISENRTREELGKAVIEWDEKAKQVRKLAYNRQLKSDARQINVISRIRDLLREDLRALQMEQTAIHSQNLVETNAEAATASREAVPGITRRLMHGSRFTPVRPAGLAAQGYLNNIRNLDAPSVSWIEPDELLLRLREQGFVLNSVQSRELDRLFIRMEDYTRKRLVGNVRWLTVVTALAVALVFQVSAVGLLRDLSVNPEIRARYVGLATDAMEEAEGALSNMPSFQEVSEAALAELQENNPGAAAQIEQAAGIGATREEIVAELELIMREDLPERGAALVAEYEDILNRLHSQAANAAMGHARDITHQLARFDIQPLAHGLPFYQSVTNWIGMLLTTSLLTLGAPFWFDALRNLSSLRDALKPRQDPTRRMQHFAGGRDLTVLRQTARPAESAPGWEDGSKGQSS